MLRMPQEAPRETESAPKTSPLPRVAAKTVAFGRFHATCRTGAPRTVPRETSRAGGPSPLGCSVARASWEGPKALTVPDLGGFRGVRARNPWQCQSWVASGASAPETPGSANAQWRHCRARPTFPVLHEDVETIMVRRGVVDLRKAPVPFVEPCEPHRDVIAIHEDVVGSGNRLDQKEQPQGKKTPPHT